MASFVCAMNSRGTDIFYFSFLAYGIKITGSRGDNLCSKIAMTVTAQSHPCGVRHSPASPVGGSRCAFDSSISPAGERALHARDGVRKGGDFATLPARRYTLVGSG